MVGRVNNSSVGRAINAEDYVEGSSPPCLHTHRQTMLEVGLSKAQKLLTAQL